MRGATDYHDERALKNPVNQVVAVVSPETDLQKVISALHSAQFPEVSIGVLRGQKDAHKLDPASGRHGWLARLAKIGPNFGDLDERYLKGYADALHAGSTVSAVVAEPGSKRREVADLLGDSAPATLIRPAGRSARSPARLAGPAGRTAAVCSPMYNWWRRPSATGSSAEATAPRDARRSRWRSI